MEPVLFVTILLMTYVSLVLFAAVSSIKKTILKTSLVCPNDGMEKEVGFFVNVFKKQGERGSVDVETCSKFCNGEGPVTCEKYCLSMKEAATMHQKESIQHRKDLLKVCGTA